MNKDDLLDFNPLCPARIVSFEEAAEIFGELYKYDFPKWCAENKLHCFFYPPTMTYVIMPQDCKPQ